VAAGTRPQRGHFGLISSLVAGAVHRTRATGEDDRVPVVPTDAETWWLLLGRSVYSATSPRSGRPPTGGVVGWSDAPGRGLLSQFRQRATAH